MRVTQRNWRLLGAACIGTAALMAVYSAISSLLRDTVIHISQRFMGREISDVQAHFPMWFVMVYWGFFAGLILLSLYLALLDMRYIRLQYLLEKRQILTGSMGDLAPSNKPPSEGRKESD